MIQRLLTATLVTWCLVANSAMAASTTPQISPAPKQSHWFAMIIAVFLFVCVAVISFRGAKRGHQD